MTNGSTYTMRSVPIEIPVQDAFGVAYSPKDRNLYVASAPDGRSGSSGTIYVYSLTKLLNEEGKTIYTYTQVDEIPVDVTPVAIFCNPQKSIAYAGGRNGLVALDTSSNTILNGAPDILDFGNLFSMAFSPDGSRSYFPGFVSHVYGVAIIDEKTKQPVPGSPVKMEFMGDLFSVSMDGKWGYYVAADKDAEPIQLLDLASPPSLVGPITANNMSITNIDISHNNLLLIATYSGVTPIDSSTNKTLPAMPVGRNGQQPGRISCSRVNDRAAMVVADPTNGSVSIQYFDTTKISPNAQLAPLIPATSGASFLAFDSYGNLYSADNNNSTVRVYPVTFLENNLSIEGDGYYWVHSTTLDLPGNMGLGLYDAKLDVWVIYDASAGEYGDIQDSQLDKVYPKLSVGTVTEKVPDTPGYWWVKPYNHDWVIAWGPADPPFASDKPWLVLNYSYDDRQMATDEIESYGGSTHPPASD